MKTFLGPFIVLTRLSCPVSAPQGGGGGAGDGLAGSNEGEPADEGNFSGLFFLLLPP